MAYYLLMALQEIKSSEYLARIYMESCLREPLLAGTMDCRNTSISTLTFNLEILRSSSDKEMSHWTWLVFSWRHWRFSGKQTFQSKPSKL